TSEENRSYKVVGDGGMTLNLFRGCTPELAASYLKSCFLAQGQGFGDSAFWVDSATELCRHALTLLMLLRPDSYSIAGLYDIVFDENDRNNLLIKGADNISRMTDREQRFFTQSQRYFVNIWNEHEDKLKKNILGTVNAVLSPFAHPDLVDAFSAGSTLGEADMSELINERSVFLVNLPMTKYGKEGARFAYLIIKLRFMNMMRERKSQSNWNQVRPVAFICDEYQAIIDSISDTDFWDKSRSTKTIGIVSMQGVSSLIHALNGNEKAANTILQNFRQRIFYRTEDEATIRHIKGILGQVDVEIESTSQSDSQSDSYSQSSSQGQSRSFSSNISTSSSIQRYDLFSSNDMRNLSADFCLFIGNIGDSAADDVLRVDPVYV
ncbi:MAG TPA: TraM recognition domain-containing protein, partial [Nitrosomonas sp.]|nr:TraM recognition domain-containing protein [Nitrosomonas sp.]